METNHSPERPEESTDDILIRLALADADAYDTPVGDPVARLIASQYHDGQGSALYAFVSTGSMHGDDLRREMMGAYMNAEQRERPALYQLMRYVRHHGTETGTRPPIEGWHDKAKWDNGNLERELIRHFAHTPTSALIDRIERAEPFNSDDEEFELNRRLRAIGKTWEWIRDSKQREQILVVDLREGGDE